MTGVEIHDRLMTFLLAAHEALGPIGLAIALSIAFFGVAAVLAFAERERSSYRNVGNVPFFENFSTIVDFALLDPILIVLIVRSTQYMSELPSLLEPVVAVSPPSYASSAASFVWLFGSAQWCLALAGGALLAWLVYTRSLQTRARTLRWTERSWNGTYIAVMTTVFMYLVLTYFFRAVVASLFVLDVTREGFRLNPQTWGYGAQLVGRFQVGFGWCAGVLAVIVVVFAVHDMWLYRTHKRRLRVAASTALAVITIAVYLASLLGVHDNLVAVVDEAVHELLASSGSGLGAAGTVRLASLRRLPVWTLPIANVAALFFWQGAGIISTMYSDDLAKPLRSLAGGTDRPGKA